MLFLSVLLYCNWIGFSSLTLSIKKETWTPGFYFRPCYPPRFPNVKWENDSKVLTTGNIRYAKKTERNEIIIWDKWRNPWFCRTYTLELMPSLLKNRLTCTYIRTICRFSLYKHNHWSEPWLSQVTHNSQMKNFPTTAQCMRSYKCKHKSKSLSLKSHCLHQKQ